LTTSPAYQVFLASPRSAGMGGPIDVRAAWGMFCHDLACWRLFGHGALMIEVTASKQCVGQVGINRGPLFPEQELGWLLYDGHEGQGYATEAALALRDWASEAAAISYSRTVSVFRTALARKLLIRSGQLRRLASAVDLSQLVHVFLGLQQVEWSLQTHEVSYATDKGRAVGRFRIPNRRGRLEVLDVRENLLRVGLAQVHAIAGRQILLVKVTVARSGLGGHPGKVSQHIRQDIARRVQPRNFDLLLACLAIPDKRVPIRRRRAGTKVDVVWPFERRPSNRLRGCCGRGTAWTGDGRCHNRSRRRFARLVLLQRRLIRLRSQLLRMTDAGSQSRGSHNNTNSGKQPQAAPFPIGFWHVQALTRVSQPQAAPSAKLKGALPERSSS